MLDADRKKILRVAELLPLVITEMRPERLDGLAYSHDESPVHLNWMIETVRETCDMPDDKAGRWLGCVYGLASAQNAVPPTIANEVWKLLSHSRGTMPEGLDFAYQAIVPELSERVRRLRDRKAGDEATLNLMQFDIDWIAAEHTNTARPSLIWASFQIGYIQGYLKAFGEIDFKEERDRTRPLMHNAYNKIGIVPPKTVERIG